MTNFREQRDKRRAEQREEAVSKKRELVEAMHRSALLKPSTQEVVEEAITKRGRELPPIGLILNATKNLPLLPADHVEVAPSGPRGALVDLVEVFFRVQRLGMSEAVLCWPSPPPGVTTIHALAVQALLSANPSTTSNGITTRPEPAPQRTLYFPWTRNSSSHQNSVLYDRHQICLLHQQHLNRAYTGAKKPEVSGVALYDLHKVMLRVQDLDGVTSDGRGHRTFLPEYGHPSLRELSTQIEIGAENGDRLGILHRVQKFTLLARNLSFGKANDPVAAPYALFGLRKENVGYLAKLPVNSFHVVLLDVTDRACNRFGDNWKDAYVSVLRAVRRRFGVLPCLAVTDNPFTHGLLQRELLPSLEAEASNGSKRKKWSAGGALLCTAGPILGADGLNSETFDGGSEIRAAGFGGIGQNIFEAINQLYARALKIRDDDGARIIRQLKAMMRRCANLPGGLEDFDQFVCNEEGIDTAVLVMGAYQLQGLLGSLSDPSLPIAQAATRDIADLKEKIEKFLREHNKTTPMAIILAETVGSLLNKSSRVLLAVRNGTVRDFAKHVLSSSVTNGDRVRHRLENEMLIPLDFAGVETLLREGGRTNRGNFRSGIGWLVLVSPRRTEATKLMALPWLPRNIIMIGDVDFLRGVAGDAERLSAHSEFGTAIQGRLKKLSVAAAKEFERRAGGAIELSWEEPPPEDVEYSLENKVLDLGIGSTGPILTLVTSNGYTIHARPGSELVRCDWDDPANPFHSSEASELKEGDEIAVLGEPFFEAARGLLDIRATAADGLRQYHEFIRDALISIAGSSLSEKSRSIAMTLGDEKLFNRVRDWINVEEYLAEDPTVVRPHASQNWEQFRAFVEALGQNEKIASFYWIWAVVATRSRRISAASQFHDAYLRLLVEPNAIVAANPRVTDGVRSLRRIAEQNVGRIERIRRSTNRDAA
jgi:hypothetical protein